MTAPLRLTREQVLAHRRRVGALDGRLPAGQESLRRAAWAGLTDSVPRAALLSIHARVAGTTAAGAQAPGLVQVWGPRFSTYVAAEEDVAVLTLGRLPETGPRRATAEDLAGRLAAAVGDAEVLVGDAARAVGVHHNQLRYAALTGRVLIRWDGARQPTVRVVPPPSAEPVEARRELVRRYLHVLGPGTIAGLARWAGLRDRPAADAWAGVAAELTAVRTDVGDAWALTRDVEALGEDAGAGGAAGPGRRDGHDRDGGPDARLLPSGDAYTLLWAEDRELLVPQPEHRAQLWTSRVWPGAVLVDGDVVGTWRRAEEKVTVTPWAGLGDEARDAVEREAAALPLPALERSISVRWEQ